MKVVIYARVSTEEQDVDKQVDECVEYCKNKDYEVVGTYKDIISGSKDSRPSLDLLMKACFNREFEAVVIWKLDRLGRSLQHLISIINQWQSYKIDLICITQLIDTTTPNGKLLFHIFGSIAEFERDLIRERTIMGMRKAKNVGKRGKDKKERRKGGYLLYWQKHRKHGILK